MSAYSSSPSWSRFSPPSNPVNGHVSTMWFLVCRWTQSQKGDWATPTPFVQVSTTWAGIVSGTVTRRCPAARGEPCRAGGGRSLISACGRTGTCGGPVADEVIRPIPAVARTGRRPSPPRLDVVVPRPAAAVVVCQRTQPAPEPRVDEPAALRPRQVRVVELVAGIETQQVAGQVASRLEVVDVDEGMRRSDGGIVGLAGAHHDRDHAVPASSSSTPQSLFHASFLGGMNPPKKAYNPPQTAAKLCVLIFFRRDSELQIHHGKFLLIDNKQRKLFVIKQSKGCRFMSKIHQNTPGPAGGAYALLQTP